MISLYFIFILFPFVLEILSRSADWLLVNFSPLLAPAFPYAMTTNKFLLCMYVSDFFHNLITERIPVE